MTAERSPLAGFEDRFSEASVHSNGLLTVAENPGWQQINLRVDPADAGALTEALGAALPTVPNTVSNIPGGFVVWLGPDEWLVIAPERQADLEIRLRDRDGADGPVTTSVVDVSCVRTAISLTGPAARTVLAHGCGLDLDASVFPPGRCAQSRVALADVVLIAPHEQSEAFDVDPHFVILVRASFAPYLASWLLDAATEFLTG